MVFRGQLPGIIWENYLCHFSLRTPCFPLFIHWITARGTVPSIHKHTIHSKLLKSAFPKINVPIDIYHCFISRIISRYFFNLYQENVISDIFIQFLAFFKETWYRVVNRPMYGTNSRDRRFKICCPAYQVLRLSNGSSPVMDGFTTGTPR